MDAIETPAWHPLDGVPPPEEVPSTWDAGHVAFRLTRAFEVMRDLPGGTGPLSGGGATWPAMLLEYAGEVDEDYVPRPRWPASVISMADEALAWPIVHLTDEPMRADAVLVWAFCKATKRSIAKSLRGRVARARAIASRMQDGENGRRSELRAALARQVAAWANERLVGVTDPERVAAIKHNAHIRFEREIADLHPVQIAPHQAMPSRILSRASLDRYLPSALEMLADRLAAARVPVR
ncbi:hypothetical protein AA309_20115 [Microvirga vignae]|uniref:Uncharacterized protein n=1 Tax=Microvirga vignae TaxID=1225564 RepID=A0A0H1R8B2_9HYPH|nr:hypothetical protein [Microvirga vignae]KLK91408.1 hypothetical protein AA309_20115 [Microvirga vignae]